MRTAIAIIIAGLALTGCAKSLSPDVYSRGEVGSAVQIEDGVVLSVRDVRIEGTRSNIGGGIGAAAGGVGGSWAGSGRAGILGAIAGAVVGAVVGAVAEDAITGSDGIEYLVRRADGDTVAVVQPKGETQLPPGTKVMLVYGDHIRIVPAPVDAQTGGGLPPANSAPAVTVPGSDAVVKRPSATI